MPRAAASATTATRDWAPSVSARPVPITLASPLSNISPPSERPPPKSSSVPQSILAA